MAVDISPELYEKIQLKFQERYKKIKVYGQPIEKIFEKIERGEALFQDADMYAVEVGDAMAEAIKEVVKIDELPNKRFYYNIAEKTVGQSLEDMYGLVSNVATSIQDNFNHSIGTELKAIKPGFDYYRQNQIVNSVSEASTQEELDTRVTEPVKTFSRRIVDETKRQNAAFQSKAGMKVKVVRKYDDIGLRNRSQVCEFCTAREGSFTYDDAMAAGVFVRHDGCGCLIEYTSAKGETTYSTSKGGGWIANPKEAEKRIIEKFIESKK